jgi:hypothetical protein
MQRPAYLFTALLLSTILISPAHARDAVQKRPSAPQLSRQKALIRYFPETTP